MLDTRAEVEARSKSSSRKTDPKELFRPADTVGTCLFKERLGRTYLTMSLTLTTQEDERTELCLTCDQSAKLYGAFVTRWRPHRIQSSTWLAISLC